MRTLLLLPLLRESNAVTTLIQFSFFKAHAFLFFIGSVQGCKGPFFFQHLRFTFTEFHADSTKPYYERKRFTAKVSNGFWNSSYALSSKTTEGELSLFKL